MSLIGQTVGSDQVKTCSKCGEEKPLVAFRQAPSGEEYHVDHIIPLAKGGLHHPDNLQVLPADLNLKKGAKV